MAQKNLAWTNTFYTRSDRFFAVNSPGLCNRSFYLHYVLAGEYSWLLCLLS